ncbi:hypothetical protein FRB98_002074 [Tulasnella sp. 332]|nr:hypothetical protein FRB98_002074 [Tulasnella sp. 332]
MSTYASLFESFLGGLEASLSVLLTLGYGVAAARFGLISPVAMKDASRLCNKLFLPALLFVNVGSQLTGDNLDKYWPVLCQSYDSLLLMALTAHYASGLQSVPAWVTIAAAFNNTNSLPLLLVQALTSTNILQSLLSGDETMEAAIDRAKSYFLICSAIKDATVSVFAALINPASIGAVLAVFIGLTPSLHKVFFSKFEEGGYLRPWLTVSIQNVGNLYTVLQMFVVGGLLNVSLQKTGDNKLRKSAVAITFFVRFILWGVIGIPLIYYLASRTTLLSDDPILWFAMMIMPIGPPAMLLSTVLEVTGAPERDQIAIAKVLAILYSVTPVICITVVAALKAAEAAKLVRGL